MLANWCSRARQMPTVGRQKTFQNRRARKTCVSSMQNDVFLRHWRSCPEQKHYFCKHPGQHNSLIKPYQNSIPNPVQAPICFSFLLFLVGGRPWRLSPGRLTSASVCRCLGPSWPAWPVTVRGSRPGWGPSRAQQQTRHPQCIYIYIYISAEKGFQTRNKVAAVDVWTGYRLTVTAKVFHTSQVLQ